LGRQKEPVTEEMVWWGIEKFLPGSLDLTKASAKQSDEAMAMLAGLITYHWPAVRLSNQACTVSKKQAASYTSDWKEACDKAGTPFDEATATDRFFKAHSFRVGDVIIGVGAATTDDADAVLRALREANAAGGAVAVRVLRDGKPAFIAVPAAQG
jgi:S1-C subfamily serine protease